MKARSVPVALLGGALAGCAALSSGAGSNGPSGTSPAPGTLTSVQKVRAALGHSVDADLAVGDSPVRSVVRRYQMLTVTLTTPEGGFQGPSTQDADALASVVLAKTYLTGWHGSVFVVFDGGLVSRATGKPAPNATAFAYAMFDRNARRIDWSNADQLASIDWSLYRTACVPVFKGCK